MSLPTAHALTATDLAVLERLGGVLVVVGGVSAWAVLLHRHAGASDGASILFLATAVAVIALGLRWKSPASHHAVSGVEERR
jgi:hypothetical protein